MLAKLHALLEPDLSTAFVNAHQASFLRVNASPAVVQASLLLLVAASLATPTVLNAQVMSIAVLHASMDSLSTLVPENVSLKLAALTVKIYSRVSAPASVRVDITSMKVSASMEVASMDILPMLSVDV